MNMNLLFTSILFLFFTVLYSQDRNQRITLGFYYGVGKDISKRDYSYNCHYYKLQINYAIKSPKKIRYDLTIQPEINFAEFQSNGDDSIVSNPLNATQISSDFANCKLIRECILNLGFKMSKPISEKCSVYLLGSIGPMITDKETDRLSSGFAFSDVFAIGLTFKTNKMVFDLRPSFRHVSNASIKVINRGYNIINAEFGVYFSL
jgi:hypothetical protein